jgi:predicted ATPase
MSEAKALARQSGLEVLAARGSELERSFSYGVVRQLFEPLLASLRAEERADLLEGAAGLAAPLFDPAQGAAPPTAESSVATLHGLHWLTANLAARRPLLLAVDDLQWCDLSSVRWLACILPRIERLDLVIIVGLRPEEPGDGPGILWADPCRPARHRDSARCA